MTFSVGTYQNLVTQPSEAQARLFRQYPRDVRPDFDIVIVGSGFGGGASERQRSTHRGQNSLNSGGRAD